MPYINIKITDKQVTQEQKSQLIKGATQLVVEVLNKNHSCGYRRNTNRKLGS